jgi:hypothetical protein
MKWLRDIFSPSNLWALFKILFPTAAAAVNGWISSLAKLPTSVTVLSALMTAACVLIILDYFQAWFDRRNVHLQRIEALEYEIETYRDVGADRANKARLLNEISELRTQMVTLRIEMERDRSLPRHSDVEWNARLNDLEGRIANKIEQFSSRAEAEIYQHRGNVLRPINPNMGGYLNPLHLDICIRDLDYLQKFIQDHSRKFGS